MSYYILSDKTEKQIKGIFNQEDKIPEEHTYFIPYYTRKNSDSIETSMEPNIEKNLYKSIDNETDILYLFFQNLGDKIDNIKLFDTKDKALKFREINHSYGYIMGFRINVMYENLYDCEYVSLKEIH